MKKYIRALEVPLLLLGIAYGCYDNGLLGLSIILGIISIIRLTVNVLTDDFIYKNNE